MPIGWKTWYIPNIDISLKTTIALDTKEIRRQQRTINGVYGHELIHAINCRQQARRLAEKYKAPTNTPQSSKGCTDVCYSIVEGANEEWGIWHRNETQHGNPESPLPGEDYPINHDHDDLDLDIIPYPIPLPRKHVK